MTCTRITTAHRILLLIAVGIVVLVLCSTSRADGFLGIKKLTEAVVLQLREPLDSLGLPCKPDSAHVKTWPDDEAAATFTTRSTTYPFADIGIDTSKIYSDTSYVFLDQIQDIDGSTAANVELSIAVTLFTHGLPTTTYGYVQIVDDSLNNGLEEPLRPTTIGRTVNIDASGYTRTHLDYAAGTLAVGNFETGVFDSIYGKFTNSTNEDAFKATGFSTFDPTTDSTLVDVSSLVDNGFCSVIEDTIYANRADYRATGFSTHSAADVWSVATRALTDKAGFSLASTEWEYVWYNIDTTNIDTSRIGIWFTSNIGGGSCPSASDIYAEFVDGSNEDAFKATGFSTHSAADVWAVGTRALTDKAGFALTTAERAAIEDTIHANAADYKATGFSTHSAADVWSASPRTLTDKTGFSLSSGGVSAIWAELVSGYSGTSDFGGLIKTNLDLAISTRSSHSAADVYSAFTAGSNEDAFKATGFSTHSATDVWSIGTRALTDKVGFALTAASYGAMADSVWGKDTSDIRTPTTVGTLMDAKISDAGGTASITDGDMAAIIDTMFNRAVSDTVAASFFSALLRKADSASTGSGSSPWSTAQRDSVLIAIADANKGNFKANVSGLSTFNPAVDSVMADITLLIASGLIGNIRDTIHADADDYKANVSGLSTFDPSTDSVLVRMTVAIASGLIDAIGDSLIARGISTYDPAVDSVIADISLMLASGLVGEIEDAVYANRDDYKANVSGLSTLTEAQANAQCDQALSDWGKTGFALTASEWEKVWFNIDTTNVDSSEIGEWLTAALGGTGATAADVWAYTTRALTDKTNFTLTGSEWEKVWHDIDTTNVDTSEIGEWLTAALAGTGASAADVYAYFISGSNEDQFKANVSGLSTVTTAQVNAECDQALSDWGKTGFSLTSAEEQAIVDELFDRTVSDTVGGSLFGLWTQYLVNASTFDPGIDSVFADLSTILGSALPDSVMEAIWARVVDSIAWYVWANVPVNDITDTSLIVDTLAARSSGSATVDYGAINDTLSAYHGSGSWTSSGGGLYSVTIYALDTSGTDAVVPAASVVVQSTAGVALTSALITGVDGSVTVALDSGDVRIIARLGASYVFDTLSVTIAGNEDSLAVLGYDVTIDPPAGGAGYATVYGYLYKPNGVPDSGIVVRGWPEAKYNITSSSAGYIYTPYAQWDTTDATGYFGMDFPRVSVFDDSTQSVVHVEGLRDRRIAFVIDSLHIPETGNVDLSDSLSAR